MTTMLLIHNNLENTECIQHFIHEEHEYDIYNILKNCNNKIELMPYNIRPNEWFKVEINKNNIEDIKNTTWYHNHKIMRDVIKIGTIIEIIVLDEAYYLTVEIERDDGSTIGFGDLNTCKCEGPISIADVDEDYGFERNRYLYRIQLEDY